MARCGAAVALLLSSLHYTINLDQVLNHALRLVVTAMLELAHRVISVTDEAICSQNNAHFM